MDERKSQRTSDHSHDKDLREAPLVDQWFLESLLFGSAVSEEEPKNDQPPQQDPCSSEYPGE